MVGIIVFFARLYRYIQHILAGRQRTSGVRGEDAWRIVCFIKIERYVIIGIRMSNVYKSPASVCFLTTGLIRYYYEELIFTTFEYVQLIFFTLQLEYKFAG